MSRFLVLGRLSNGPSPPGVSAGGTQICRFVSLIALIPVMALDFAACGGEAAPDAAAPEGAAAAEEKPADAPADDAPAGTRPPPRATRQARRGRDKPAEGDKPAEEKK